MANRTALLGKREKTFGTVRQNRTTISTNRQKRISPNYWAQKVKILLDKREQYYGDCKSKEDTIYLQLSGKRRAFT